MTGNFDEYKSMIGHKLNKYKDRLIVSGARSADAGFSYTANRIMQSAENLFFSMSEDVNDPVDAMFAGFSSRPGFSDVENVAAVNVVDISIISTINSIMGYTAVERPMSTPIDTIFWDNLVAANSAGGFSAGDTVVDPFKPYPTNIDLGASSAAKVVTPTDSIQESVEVSLDADVLPGTVTIVATLADASVATGSDLRRDGIIYFSNGSAVASATVDYATGKVTLKGVAANTVADKIAVSATIDTIADSTGDSTLKVKQKLNHATVTSSPKRIILDTAVEDIAYMNKQAYQLQTAGVSMDFGKRGIINMLNAYTAYVDVTIVGKLYQAAKLNTPVSTFDLTAYSLAGSEASTKNDMVNQFVININKKLMKQSKFGATAYVCDTEGAAVLGNNPMYFTPNALFDTQMNGMIGTYRGKPVVRHNALDGRFDNDGSKYGYVQALYKSADGKAGPVAFSEYLPPYSIRPAFNYDNPGQMAQALFAQNTTDVIVPQLTAYGLIKIA